MYREPPTIRLRAGYGLLVFCVIETKPELESRFE